MRQKRLLLTVFVSLLGMLTTVAQVHYRFVPTDYVSTDNYRAPQSAFAYDDQSFTITATGQNNVAFKMGAECDGKYYINGTDHWFVAAGSDLKTGTADAYLWWINGANKGTQVAPDYVSTTTDGRRCSSGTLRMATNSSRGSLPSENARRSTPTAQDSSWRWA